MGLNILAWVKAKKYTDNAVSQSAALHREIVQTLPLTGDEHVIYMVPVTGSGDDNYNEYMWINGTYELIGNTRVDLTDYYNKTQVDAALSGKANAATSIAGYGITDAYTKTEIDTALSGKAGTSDIPTALSQLTADATHRLVTDTEKSTWNDKSNFSGSYTDLTNKPTIPTKTSDLTNDSGFSDVIVERITVQVSNISANSYEQFTFASKKEGYYTLGIAGISFAISPAYGISISSFAIGNRAYTERGTIVISNNTNSQKNLNGYMFVDMLYKKL